MKKPKRKRGWGLNTVLGQLAMMRGTCKNIAERPDATMEIRLRVSHIQDKIYDTEKAVRAEMERKKNAPK